MLAKDAAEKTIKKYRTSDPYILAEKMDIIIHRVNLGAVRGMCYNTRRIRQIFLHYDLPDHLERFVLGHEIGHLIMHPDSNAPFLRGTLFSKERYELEANEFAIRLIMPDMDIMEHWDYTIDQWAMVYGLPKEIIKLRFKNGF